MFIVYILWSLESMFNVIERSDLTSYGLSGVQVTAATISSVFVQGHCQGCLRTLRVKLNSCMNCLSICLYKINIYISYILYIYLD